MNGMTLKIDKAGRIVVPRALRERLGLRAGTDLDVSETAEGIMLRRASAEPAVVEEDGFLVHQGVAPRGFDWDRHAEEQRQERHRQVLAL
jgi:AbrB family looped-hinge helix DNA binding protein